jgi:hypothetical protein
VKLSDSQTDFPKTLAIDITGVFDLKIGEYSIKQIPFDPFEIKINLPQTLTLDAFGESLKKSLSNATDA